MNMNDIRFFAKKENELLTLIQTVRIFSQETGIKVGIEKCAMLMMNKEKRKTFMESNYSSRNSPERSTG